MEFVRKSLCNLSQFVQARLEETSFVKTLHYDLDAFQSGGGFE